MYSLLDKVMSVTAVDIPESYEIQAACAMRMRYGTGSGGCEAGPDGQGHQNVAHRPGTHSIDYHLPPRKDGRRQISLSYGSTAAAAVMIAGCTKGHDDPEQFLDAAWTKSPNPPLLLAISEEARETLLWHSKMH